MQENEFEKQVRHQLDDFSLVPTQQVWQNVQTQIRQEKRRRLFFYWFLAAVFLIGITTTVFFVQKPSGAKRKTVRLTKKPANEERSEKLITKRQSTSSKLKKHLIKDVGKARRELAAFSDTYKNSVSTNSKNNSSSLDSWHKQPIVRQKEQDVSIVEENKTRVLQAKKAPEKREDINSLAGTRMQGRSPLAPHKYLLVEKAKQDTSHSAASINKRSNVGDTIVISASDNKIKQSDGKTIHGKWRTGFTIYGGSSDNVRGIAAPSEKSFAAPNLSTASPSPVNLTSPAALSLQYKTSASFGIGTYLERALTKKLIISVGIDYHFMSAKSTVGNKTDSALTVFDSVLQKTAVASTFYRAGQTTNFSNSYHLLQLPVSLQIQLDNSSKHPLLFGFGLSPSLIISSNALYLNYKINGYYQEKEQFNHFLLFGQSELLYALNNGERFRLSIGPTVQYDLNSFSKTVINHPQHFIFTGLKASITFK